MKRTAQDPVNARNRARQWFFENGIAVSKWARENGFRRQTVVQVLSGRMQGIRGEAHKVAVALGIKPEPKITTLKTPK